MQCLGGSDINSISQRGNDQSRTITQVFIGVLKSCISDSDFAIIFGPIEFQLRLPLELVGFSDVFLDEFICHISPMSIECNQAHDLLSHGSR